MCLTVFTTIIASRNTIGLRQRLCHSIMIQYFIFILYLIGLGCCFGHAGDNSEHMSKTWTTKSNVTHETIDVHLTKSSQDRYDVAIDLHREREACEEEVLTRISPANYTDQVTKMFIGPDELVFYVEGKELLAYVPKYVACGRYHASFHLLLSGAYHFKVVRLRNNFTALNEYVELYPRIHYETLVSDWVELVGSKSKSASCHHIHYGAWIQKSLLPITQGNVPSNTSVYDSIKSAESVLPIDYHNGDDRALPLRSMVPLGSEHDSKGCLMNADLYSYEPLTGCHWDHITADEASEILSQKKLAIAGDSHMRIFGNMLLKWACGIDMPFQKGKYTHHMIKNETGTRCMGMSISYSANYYCSAQSFTWHPWKIEDFILLNCGHHAASQEHQPVDVYKETMINFVKHANTSGSGITHKNFIWLESNPQPFRDDGFVIDNKDWRTQHRLLLYNQIANSIFFRHNYTVMYGYQSLLPFTESMCDYAHYTATGALYPQFMQFLHIIKSKS